jgi:hypothetical protein
MGIPKVPVPLISKAIIHCASSTDETAASGLWLLKGGDDVLLIRKWQRELREGVYRQMNERLQTIFKIVGWLQSYRMMVLDIAKSKAINILAVFVLGFAGVALLRILHSEYLPIRRPLFSIDTL